jgi:hypothetical protein
MRRRREWSCAVARARSWEVSADHARQDGDTEAADRYQATADTYWRIAAELEGVASWAA